MKKFKHNALALGIAMAISGTANADLNDGLVAYYPFNGNAHDESGNGNDGTEHGSIQYVDGVIGKAISFDENNFIQIADSASLDTDNSMTLSLWFNPLDFASEGSKLIGKWYSSPWSGGGETRGEGDWVLNVTPSGKIVFSIANYPQYGGRAEGRDIVDSADKLTVTIGSWVNVITTFQSGSLKLYVNGELIQQKDSHLQSISATEYAQDDIFIGSHWNGHQPYKYQGLMDDVRIYNRALSKSEIGELYQLGSEPTKTYEDGLNEGIAKCQNDPASCGITVPPESGNCPRVDTHASFSPSDGVLTIPAVCPGYIWRCDNLPCRNVPDGW